MRNGRPYAVGIMPIVVASFAALAVGYGLGEQAQLGEQEAQTVTQEVRQTGDVKRLCMTVKTGERIDAMNHFDELAIVERANPYRKDGR